MIAQTTLAQNRDALVCIRNNTNRSIRYQYKWDTQGGKWRLNTLNAKKGFMHWWPYDNPNRNISPKFLIRFDADLSQGAYWTIYSLEKTAVSQRNCNNVRKINYFIPRGSQEVDLIYKNN